MRIVEILKKNYFFLISTFFFIYIAFNLLDGERGLFSYFEKKEIQNQLIQKKNNLTAELNDFEKKILDPQLHQIFKPIKKFLHFFTYIAT